MSKILSLAGILALNTTMLCAQSPDAIRLNQIGFYPKAIKHAVVIGKDATKFYVVGNTSKDTVFTGNLAVPLKSPFSEKYSQLTDFSSFQKAGKYFIYVPGVGQSFPFEIKDNIHEEVLKGAIKSYYFQRHSIALTEKYAGKWARKAGHPDDKVLIHASAVSANRPEGTLISAPKGWYDAGDYNKYIVNSGITMNTLLSALEDYPNLAQKLNLNIPESGNKLPDLADEILWNLRWMLAMQDPGDGGVYHKLTNADFDGMEMPSETIKPRYVVQKSTSATLDFAAVMAQSARILPKYKLNKLADSCKIAAENAWKWAEANPAVFYQQEKMNKTFKPAITTGAYGDGRFDDEWYWAAAELYVLTKGAKYLESVEKYFPKSLPIPSWNQTFALGHYALLNQTKQPAAASSIVAKCKQQILDEAEKLIENPEKQFYHTVFGNTARDYMWGSNSHNANQGILLLKAYLIAPKQAYLDAALENLDYILGRNGTGYSFVTGFGSKQVMHPHHRPSEADGIVEPIPGLLSGGPNPGQQDHCQYASSVPDESFVDDVCSYASNEIAINWNAPLVYLLMGVESFQKSK
ncbi:MAG: glycoside hydrolase family 9 protein [Bacteroidetes bacterium]|nr:glycoside hydrolase family 9 protein [Bacteroidota bacterium]